MDTVRLGRTGLDVSVAGLGAGGHSRLGRAKDATDAEAADLVRAALDRGITIVDTAPAYGTEAAVGAGLSGRRDRVVLSTKVRPTRPDTSFDSTAFITPQDLRESVESSLSKLRTDRIDILHLHGVRPHQYPYCRDELLPELMRLREGGKVRYLGITEGFGVDRDHDTLRQAVADGVWDVLMLGYNFVNPSVTEHVLPGSIEKDLGVLCMFAVRGALARPDSLKGLVDKLVAQGEVDPADIPAADPSAFVLGRDARSLTDFAYRFCRHTPGIHVVLTGTGSLGHLEQNIAAINGAPLPPAALRRVAKAFGRVRTATGDPV